MEKLPTIKEIAKRLKVSASTVSRALHNHPSIGLVTTMRVHKIAQELNYEPNQTAIFFKQRKTFTIGVVVPNLSEAFFSSAISGIEEFAGKFNYTVLLGQSLDDFEREKRIVDTMKDHRVDGIIASVSKNTCSYTHLEKLKQYRIPIVFFDRIPDLDEIHHVSCNLQTGMHEAILSLAAGGHRKIAIINGPATMLASRERLEIYKQSLQSVGMAVYEGYVVETDLSQGATYRAMHQLLDLPSRPSAVLAFNDYVAMDAMSVAKQHHLRINQDISFISFANLPQLTYLDHPPLASIEQFPYEQGEKATEILLKILSQAPLMDSGTYHQVVISSKLIAHQEDLAFM